MANSAPGISNYKFGQKNHWRRTAWNEIARRVKDKKNARIIYLAGEQNLDAIEAKRRGFDPRNMIAVEVDKARVLSLRRNGVNTINADLMDVLYNWPEKHRADVVIADFCFGFEAKSVDLFDSLGSPSLSESVCLINFQRGRDSSTNELRKILGEDKVFIQDKKGSLQVAAESKHRAAQYLRWHAHEFATLGTSLAPDISMSVVKMISSRILSSMNPAFYSYKSGRVFMDSAVFSHPFKSFSQDSKDLIYETGSWISRYAEEDQEVKKMITAAIAVQHRKRAA